MKPMLRTILLVAGAFVAFNAPSCGFAAQREAPSPVPCPTFTPLFGLMPFLMWLGVLPKPVLASNVTPSDTSTSIVIRPDPTDQITCGKTPIKTFNDVVFTTRTLSSGKQIDLLMDVQVPDTPGKKPLVIYV